MARLIDADELRKRLDEGVWNDAVAEVDAMPTAYNVDKVVEQLEEGREVYRKLYNEHLEDVDLGSWEAYEDAIEIVRKGGVSDEETI